MQIVNYLTVYSANIIVCTIFFLLNRKSAERFALVGIHLYCLVVAWNFIENLFYLGVCITTCNFIVLYFHFYFYVNES
jgi:hypothetical protein